MDAYEEKPPFCLSTVGRSALVFLAFFCVSTAVAAPPTTTDDVVILARSKLLISRGARQVTGQVVVNETGGFVIAHPLFKAVAGTQLVADKVTVRVAPYHGPTFFDLFTNTFNDLNGTAVITGAGPTAVTLPLFPFPTVAAVTPGTTNVSVGKDNPVTLPPGDYRDIILRARADLYLEGGIYNVRVLRGGISSRVLFNGTTTLNVAEQMRLGQRVVFGPAFVDALSGRCIVVNTPTTRPSRFGPSSNVIATVNAPNSRLRLGRFGDYRGNFTANQAIIGMNAVLEAAPPLTDPCP